MNHTGVIKMYLIQSKKYAYRSHFARALAPEWVLEALNMIMAEVSIGFEDGAEEDLQGMVQEHQKTDANDYELVDDAIDIEDDDVTIVGGADRVDVITKSIESIEELWHKDLVKTEVKKEQAEETENEDCIDKPEGTGVEKTDKTQGYVTRYGRVSRPPQRLMETAYGVIHETYLQNFCDASECKSIQMIETTYMMIALLFQKAMENRPEEAMKALHEEVMKALKIDFWEPVHPRDMTEEE
jgi:hypothetical protein